MAWEVDFPIFPPCSCWSASNTSKIRETFGPIEPVGFRMVVSEKKYGPQLEDPTGISNCFDLHIKNSR